VISSCKETVSQKGFTLLETMIALAIIVFVFSSILMVESASLTAIEKSKRMNEVAMLAKTILTETEVKIEGLGFEEVESKKEGRFDPPYESYRWTREIKEMEFPALTPPQSEDGSIDGMTEKVNQVMTEFFSKSLLELTIPIFWPRGDKEQSFSVGFWWVNLENEIQI